MEVYRYNGVDYSTLSEMELSVGNKSPRRKFKEDDIWVNEYIDFSEEHMNYMEQLDLEMQLRTKQARYNYLKSELVLEDKNYDHGRKYGILKYPSRVAEEIGLSVGDTCWIRDSSDYEMEVEGEKVYRTIVDAIHGTLQE